MATIHDSAGKGIGQDNPLYVVIDSVNCIVPTDEQNVYDNNVVTHNGITVGINSWNSESSFHSSDGFTTLSCLLKSDNSVQTNSVFVYWSVDGSTNAGGELIIPSGVGGGADATLRAGTVQVKAPYFKIAVANYDTGATHVMTNTVFLQS